MSVDRLHGMEYKHSGTSLTSNLCENWQKNAFGMKDMISKYGNLDVCTLKKVKNNKSYLIYTNIFDYAYDHNFHLKIAGGHLLCQ